MNLTIALQMKRCRKCQQVKTRAGFASHAGSSDGLQARCKVCHNADRREKRRRRAEADGERLACLHGKCTRPGKSHRLGHGFTFCTRHMEQFEEWLQKPPASSPRHTPGEGKCASCGDWGPRRSGDLCHPCYAKKPPRGEVKECVHCGRQMVITRRGACSSCWLKHYGRRIVCVSCGESAIHSGRGLCKPCYQAHRRAGKLEKFPPIWKKASA